ncbi:MAG: CD225/dispanin family protein [Bacteroidaceae bacterium]|nr:CD225/dispanin family protein [Bacteroidaceae bacterium]
MYYYIDSAGQQQGPFPADILPSKGVTGETLVWKAGMTQWTKAKMVPELKNMFAAPPVPPYVQGQTTSTGQAVPPPPPSGDNPKPDNYMLWAVLSTVCCCIPIGAYAIYCAAQVDTLYRQGDYAGALAKANDVKTWSIIAAVAGAVVNGIYMFVMIASSAF